ncbi:MAG: hypothetical protein AB7S78_01670 [Candidatus Omnitrophota bacterium]
MTSIPAIVVALITLVCSHQFAAWRDRENKRREQRIKYLVDVFRSLAKANHHPRIYEVADDVEQAVSDIQLFGNKKQIVSVQKLVNELVSQKSADLDALLTELRKSLRKELGSDKYSGKLIWLRITRTPSSADEPMNTKRTEL